MLRKRLNHLLIVIVIITLFSAKTVGALNLIQNNTDYTFWSKNGSSICADEDSMEIVIGVDCSKPEAYANLVDAVAESRGKIVNTVSVRGEVIAIVADMPLNTVSSFREKASKSTLARYIEPNVKFQALLVPNDQYWSVQWGPQKIRADWAWNTTTGNSSILVAVIDTGVDYTHPDLAANYVPLGFDWVNNDNDPIDDNGHGTHYHFGSKSLPPASFPNFRGGTFIFHPLKIQRECHINFSCVLLKVLLRKIRPQRTRDAARIP